MSKFKAGKLLVVSLFAAAFSAQSVAADLPTAGGSKWVNFSDPTAIYSKVGIATGSEGVDVYAGLAGYLTGQFEQNITIEVKHDMDYFNVNYLAFNTSEWTGFTLDTHWDDEYNQVAVGVIKKLVFQENQNINVYPAMKFGHMWSWDDTISSTTYVKLDAAIRYSVNPNFWIGITPDYKYALNGEDINDLNATIDIGYQLAEEVALSAHATNSNNEDDDEVWADFTFAF